MSLDQEVSFTLLRVGWHLAVCVFCADYPGEALALAGSHPQTVI
jgi:hypothetical protein